MRGTELLDKMELVDPGYVEKADALPKRKQRGWLKWGAAAACLCLAVAGILLRGEVAEPGRSVLHWEEGWQAEDYFRYCDTDAGGSGSSASLDSAARPYGRERSFSDPEWRERLEEDGVIPKIDTHPLFNCLVHYNSDGSIYSVSIAWHRRGEKAQYSDLKLTAGYQEVDKIEDCISVAVDEQGNIVQPHITVTRRDGVQIVAEGRENQGKTVTYQTDSGWYQITGSFNDSYDAVVRLLDWFWEHPLDFGLFPMEAGDHYEFAMLSDYPQAFSGRLPDFAAFGFVETQAGLILKNGEPVTFEGHYVAHADEELVKAGDYYDVEGHTTVHWCFKAEPDYYDVENSIGELAELTEQQVMAELARENSVTFLWDGSCVIVFPDCGAEAWALIESLMT